MSWGFILRCFQLVHSEGWISSNRSKASRSSRFAMSQSEAEDEDVDGHLVNPSQPI